MARAFRARAVFNIPQTYAYDGNSRPNVTALAKTLAVLKPDVVIVERVHAREITAAAGHRRDPAREWSLAQGFGMLLAALHLEIAGRRQLHMVTPSVWKGRMGSQTASSKALI